MRRLSTAFLIYALAIVVNQVGATAHFYTYEEKTDQLATEAKNRAVTIIDGPKYVTPPSTPPPPAPTNDTQPEKRPPSKPPIKPIPDKHGKPKYVELPRIYIGQIQNLSHLRNQYPKMKIHTNPVYKFQKVIPIPPNRNMIHPKHQQLVFAASTSKPSISPKSPKFSLPIETINGIRADFVRPPHFVNTTTTTTTTTTASTTTRYLRTKRIWPKRILDKLKASNTTANGTNTSANYTDNELSPSASNHRIRVVLSDNINNEVSTSNPSTRAPYRRVTRVPKKKPTTPSPTNYSTFEPNDWVPIVPSHYPVKKVRKLIRNRRSYKSDVYHMNELNESPAQNKRMMYLHSFGLVPVASSSSPTKAAFRKSIIYMGKSKQLKPHVYSGYRGKPVVHKTLYNGDYQTDESNPSNVLTKIKHHHHHHHHRYIKTIEKPVRVEVPKPVPVPVPMPVRVNVERKVPYPVQVKVPHPVPVKVIEKQYVPKPYPVVQHVPVIKHVEVKVPQPVPVPVEKKVPYPVQVEVPVPKPYPVAVPVEKRVPYPVPVRILVPQPYPVETKVPVHVKHPVEVIKHVPVKVPVPQPYPVRVPQPVPVPFETKVPYPVEVERKVPVPYKVLVPKKVEVEKQVPVYVPSPFPVERRVPVPVKVPYAVRVPIKVPVGIPILIHPSPGNDAHVVSSGVTVANDGATYQQQQQQKLTHYAFAVMGNTATSTPQNTVTVQNNGNQGTEHLNNINSIINTITDNPQQTVTVHGTPGFQRLGLGLGFQSRSDTFDEPTTPYSLYDNSEISSSTESSTENISAAFSNAIVVADDYSTSTLSTDSSVSR